MSRLLHRTSFTTRLLAIAAAVMAVLVVIDYVALLQLPSRIARDTVEIALRENVESLNATFREDRAELVDAVSPFSGRPDVQRMVIARDRDGLEPLVRTELGPNVEFEFIAARHIDGSGLGVITAPIAYRTGRTSFPVVFYKPVDDEVLDRAANAAGNGVSFAMEQDDSYVARSDNFPDGLRAREVASAVDTGLAQFESIDIGGDRLHVYSRTVTSDDSYQLHALSSPQIERVALADIRGDVRTAIAGMTLATMLAFILLVLVTSRSMRGVASRVRSLADGDYGSSLPVHGNDAFADLGASVNRLSSQLQHQVGQLEDTARAFRRTLETLEEGICVWDEEGAIAYWNRGAEQITGVPRERATPDETVVGFLHAERSPGTRRVTLPIGRRGTGLVVDLVVTAMPDGGILQTFRDTTMLDMLQQTQRNFMATAAHQLRTPITTILGFADTLSNPELELTDKQRDEFVQIIGEQSRQLQEIADAFFTNHQLANERVEVSIGRTRLQSVVADAVERVARSLPDRASEIEQLEISIPPGSAVLADRRALVGSVSVLVENAIKYGSPPITISAERSGGTVSLLVRDEGPGIDPYHQGRLFDPFYRVDVDMRSGVGGAGLGLFTARKLVEAMHGVIVVRSSPGAGATFVIELPAAPGMSDSDEDSGPQEGDGDDSGSLRLVV